MSDEPGMNPLELALDLPKTAAAGEWIPVLVQAKRPDTWPTGVKIRNLGTRDTEVQIDRDFLDRDTEIRPGETYNFTALIQVPKQRTISFDSFFLQINETGKSPDLIALPKKLLQVRPSLGKEIDVSLEPVCIYAEGTKAVLKIKHCGSTLFRNLTINISPEKAVWSGKPVVQRQSFVTGNEENLDLVLNASEIDVKLSAYVENERAETVVTLKVTAPPQVTEKHYRFLEPRRQFDARLEVHEIDSSGTPIAPVFLDQHSWWPLTNGTRYQIVIRPKSGESVDSVHFRDIPGVIYVRNEEQDPRDGAWKVMIDIITNHWAGRPEVLYYDVDSHSDKAVGEMPIYLTPPWWKYWQVAGVLGAAMTLQGATSAVTKFLHRPDDLFELFTDFKINEDYNLLFLFTIPIGWAVLKFVNAVQYRLQS